jgi:hypothetical protein
MQQGSTRSALWCARMAAAAVVIVVVVVVVVHVQISCVCACGPKMPLYASLPAHVIATSVRRHPWLPKSRALALCRRWPCCCALLLLLLLLLLVVVLLLLSTRIIVQVHYVFSTCSSSSCDRPCCP